MIATYAAVLAVGGASAAVGQAALALCGVRRWSWLAPAIGLGLVCAICWATVRIGENGVVPALLVPLLAIAAVVYLRGRLEGGGDAWRLGLPVAAAALLATSLPFVVEGHFGILGTGFNPDMSQHLRATDRLAEGHSSQLLRQGYPLGPHAVVVALNEGLGFGLVQGFTGLTIAAAVIAPLTALAVFGDRRGFGRIVSALVVGLAYLVASYYAQGAFKEVTQTVLVLAFVLALRESGRAWSQLTLRYVPAALIAIGSVYVYSFPGLIWLAAIAAAWLALESRRINPAAPAGGGVGGTTPEEASATAGGGGSPAPTGPAGLMPVSLAVLILVIGALPELGRMIDFKQFETFDPSGPGLGNLFGQVSPFTALGIWPSGDFRVAAGDGAVPAVFFYLGAAFAAVLLLLGVRRAWREGERALLAGLASVAAMYLVARFGGTAYTAAKALMIAGPVLALAILLPSDAAGRVFGDMRQKGAPGPLVALYLAAAGACSLLALANAPVGPSSYSPALTGLRPLLGQAPTLVLAPDSLLADEHGERYIAWELRGGRVCIEPQSAAGRRLQPGIRYVVTEGPPAAAPYPRLVFRRQAGPYVVWERRGVLGGPGPCPLIAVRAARRGP